LLAVAIFRAYIYIRVSYTISITHALRKYNYISNTYIT
jgi:hypothetical protein